MDRLKAVLITGLIFVAAACGGGGGRPKRLLSGVPAPEFRPVPGSVVTTGRVVRPSSLGDRFDECLPANDAASISADAVIVERVGVGGESLTFAAQNGTGVYACDGGVDPAGERRLPWCGLVFGERDAGRLLDARLDVNCRDRDGNAIAYAFVEPIAGAHWIGVQQDGYVELYETLAGLPVRIATSRGIDLLGSRATVLITQYDVAGRLLGRAELEVAVAG